MERSERWWTQVEGSSLRWRGAIAGARELSQGEGSDPLNGVH